MVRGKEQQLGISDSVHLLATDPATAVQAVQPGNVDDAQPAAHLRAPKRARMELPPAQQATSPAASDSRDHSAPAGPLARPPPVVLVLCGVQGAGKSTFALALVQQGQRWVRVNQDSVASGRKGSRQQCLSAAKAALEQGSGVVIDRTNVTPGQRAPFVAQARLAGAPIHCLVLDLPVRVCGARAAGRRDHEGGLSGGRAYGVVGMTHKELREAGPPRLAEGFASVCTCQSDSDVAAALQAWAAYGVGHPEPWAEFERARPAKPPALASGLQPIDAFFQRKQPQQQQQQPVALGGAGSSTACSALRPDTAVQQRHQQAAGPQKSANAFDVLMTAAKHPIPPPPPPPPPPRLHPSSGAAGGSRHTFAATHHTDALMPYADTPERLPGAVLHQDESCVLVEDRFPKAKHHVLVISRLPRLQGPLDLKGPEDAPLVRHMLEVGRRWAAEHGGGAAFRFGFHSVPSMRRLHLHVISQDLDSPRLKTTVHWNSFTTAFFVDAEGVVSELQAGRALQYDVAEREALLKEPMRCHRCGAAAASMPRSGRTGDLLTLKAHITSCAGPVS